MSDRKGVLIHSHSLSPGMVVVLFGLVSLFGDMTYEGSRSILPSYLKLLGFTALSIGFVLGVAEFTGYVFRVLAGFLVDNTKAYWAFILFGYLTLIVVPCMGFVNDLYLIFLLIFVERIAKGLRSPARNAVFSVLTKDIGMGKAFGIHEFFDQFGAFLGPSFVAFVLYRSGVFSLAFLVLFIPYAFVFVLINFLYYKTREQTRVAFTDSGFGSDPVVKENYSGFSYSFWLYLLAVFLNALFLLPVAIILYVATGVLTVWSVPTLYMFIQAVDAVSSLLSGYFYDKAKFLILGAIFLLSLVPGVLLLVLPVSVVLLLGVSVIYGIILGAQESIYRARIAELTHPSKRGSGYSWFNLFYGSGVLLSSIFFGFLVDHLSFASYGIFLVVIFQFVSFILLRVSMKM